MREVQALEIGSVVKIGEHFSIKAVVNQVCITKGVTQYFVKYWDDSEYKDLWIDEDELQIDKDANLFTVKLRTQ